MQHTAEDIILEEKRFFVMQIGCRVTSHFTFYGTIYIYIYIHRREREREGDKNEGNYMASISQEAILFFVFLLYMHT